VVAAFVLSASVLRDRSLFHTDDFRLRRQRRLHSLSIQKDCSSYSCQGGSISNRERAKLCSWDYWLSEQAQSECLIHQSKR